jgi:hypothetical protein
MYGGRSRKNGLAHRNYQGGGESIESIRTQYTEQLEANKILTDVNKKLKEANLTLEGKLDKIITQKDDQQKEINDQAEKLTIQEGKMKEMEINLALLMAERTKPDGDVDMSTCRMKGKEKFRQAQAK